ncbi:ribonuclease HI [Labilibaculum sp. DW002]|uniref:ribonuclease H n=1 Tax=Paralabilibaculum antarcticum TaxID=2912572 RepID=A0ABT5VQ38_9BACT|nr:ribonuclease H [Labilibaculum sp. DW002]MDE5416369.1 ribonuclease HI [Labilibaculum sp. DW002]
MKAIKIKVQIQTIKKQEIECILSDEKESIRLIYFPVERNIVYFEDSHLVKVVRKIEFQFEKVIRSAIQGNLRLGQTINCVFFDGFNFLKEADYQNYIRVDRRTEKLKITTSKTEMEDTHKIYADGSYMSELKQSGYGGFIETPDGEQKIYHQSFKQGSSNMMELLAVLEGVEHLESIEKIQVNTDSRFVIRGLVQWIHFWQHNNWQTAFGSEVKFAKYWQKINRLCEGKLMEFKWIKGHSGNAKQDFCHWLARESTNGQK